MDYQKITTELKNYDAVNVEIYVNYLKFLELDKKKDNTLSKKLM